MSFEYDTRTAPACWASMLINGDASGLDDADALACAQWETALAEQGWSITGTTSEQAWFAHSCDAFPYTRLGGDVLAYTLLRIG